MKVANIGHNESVWRGEDCRRVLHLQVQSHRSVADTNIKKLNFILYEFLYTEIVIIAQMIISPARIAKLVEHASSLLLFLFE